MSHENNLFYQTDHVPNISLLEDLADASTIKPKERTKPPPTNMFISDFFIILIYGLVIVISVLFSEGIKGTIDLFIANRLNKVFCYAISFIILFGITIVIMYFSQKNNYYTSTDSLTDFSLT